MRNTFKLSFLVVALAVAGCSSQSKPTELGTVGSQGLYDSQIQDALGGQRYTEAQMIAQRQFNQFQTQLDELEDKRRQLDASLNARAYESGLAEAPGSAAEATRIAAFQDATRQSQSFVAEVGSQAAIQQALIENKRDQDLLAEEREAARLVEEARKEGSNELASEIDALRNDIEGQRALEMAARAERSKQFEEQRFALAVANAEAQRQAKVKLDEEALKLTQLQSELAAQEARVAAARTELTRYDEVAASLRSTTVAQSVTGSGAPSELVQLKESELAQLKSEAEARTNRRIKQIEAELADRKAQIVSKARTEIAALSANTELAKASIVAPVVTGRAVYPSTAARRDAPAKSVTKASSPTPKPATKRPQSKPIVATPPSAPVLTVNTFEPRVQTSPTVPGSDEIGGAVLAIGSRVTPPAAPSAAAPLLVAAKTRSVFDVFYVYNDKDSWERFQAYLKAYGITDFEPVHNNRTGEFFIYCGRYYDDEEAASRVAWLNAKTNTKHVQSRETHVPN